MQDLNRFDSNFNTPLFSELTPAQAAVVQAGFFKKIIQQQKRFAKILKPIARPLAGRLVGPIARPLAGPIAGPLAGRLLVSSSADSTQSEDTR